MKCLKMFLAALLISFCATAGTFAAVEVNKPAPDFMLIDSQGTQHSLSDYKGKYVILEWVNFECPFVVKHYKSGNMQSLQEKMTAEGIAWLSINSSADGKQGCFTPEEINEHINESSANPTAYLIDKDGAVGKMYEAKTTPHMYVINPEGNLIYQGAIDSIPSFDVADIEKATNYVMLAINEAKSGKALSTPVTKSYGCSVKY